MNVYHRNMGFVKNFKDERRRQRLLEEAHELTGYANSLVKDVDVAYHRYMAIDSQSFSTQCSVIRDDVRSTFDEEAKLRNPFYRALSYGAPEAVEKTLHWTIEVWPSSCSSMADPRSPMINLDGDIAYVSDPQYFKKHYRRYFVEQLKEIVHVEPHPSSLVNPLGLQMFRYQHAIADRDALVDGLAVYNELVADEQNLVDAISSLNDMIAHLKAALDDYQTAITIALRENDEDDLAAIDEHTERYTNWKQHI